ncbi:MAG: hypothetical protein AB1730_18745 [Myxococcota bacterium]
MFQLLYTQHGGSGLNLTLADVMDLELERIYWLTMARISFPSSRHRPSGLRSLLHLRHPRLDQPPNERQRQRLVRREVERALGLVVRPDEARDGRERRPAEGVVGAARLGRLEARHHSPGSRNAGIP